jgi:hypothetical protein
MGNAQGAVEGMRIQQEGSSVVLRFVLRCYGGERIPIEMRGEKVLGVLHDGDHVQMSARGRRVRGREGVARPERLSNVSTQSSVRVARRGVVKRMSASVFGLGMGLGTSVAVSAVSGLIVFALTGWLGSLVASAKNGQGEGDGSGGGEGVPAALPVEIAPFWQDWLEGGLGETPVVLISLVAGAAVMLLVFFLVYLRRRRA